MSAVLDTPARQGAWRQALPAVAVALLAVLLLYRSTFAAMVEIWARSDTFAHAFLVPAIVLWLVWRMRGEVAAIQPRPQPWALLPLALAALGWLLGDLAGVNAVAQLSATALLVLVVPAVLGWAVARRLAFPLGFLFFMVPIGEFMMPTLMNWTADFTVFALTASGVPVYREGLQFVIPSGYWSVVEACSGVRYLIASVMVGTLFAYLNYRSLRRRLLFCGVAVLVPVLANWLRAYMIVMIGHLSDNRLAVGVDHLIYGWVFFGVVILLMFFIGARWSEAPASPVAVPAARPIDAAPAAPAAGWLVVAGLVAVLAAPQLLAARAAVETSTAGVQLVLPELPGNPALPDAPAVLQPLFGGAAAQASRSYAAGDAGVTVHVAYFRQQGYGRKLGSADHTLVRSDDTRWNPVASGHTELQVAGESLRLRSAELLGANWRHSSSGTPRLDVRQIHWAGGRFTSSSTWATILTIAGRLAGRGDDAATLTFFTEGDAARTGPRLDAFIAAQLPTIRSHLQSTAAAR